MFLEFLEILEIVVLVVEVNDDDGVKTVLKDVEEDQDGCVEVVEVSKV